MPNPFLEEMKGWAAEFGSTRLQKAIALGFEAKGIYRAERLAAERPDWYYVTCDGTWDAAIRRAVGDKPVNPSEKALDVLVDAREVYGPQVFLGREKKADGAYSGSHVVCDWYLGRLAVCAVDTWDWSKKVST
jgi:hypothetical protein